jgi:Tol biopolymer transport system component
MVKNMTRFIPLLLIISLILNIAFSYSLHIEVEAQANNGVQAENAWGIPTAVMDADISNQTRITHNPAQDTIPGKIAFISNREGIDEIYTMNTDGSNQVRLTGTEAASGTPAFSPDGTRILFQSFRDGQIPEIYVMNADGSNQVRLTDNEDYDDYPVWTPDGNKIVFSSNRDSKNNIYIMDADGTNPVRLTNSAFSNEQPACWSPDGTKIAFASVAFAPVFGDKKDGYEICTMNLDGSNVVRLTNNTKRDFEPAWSPDGSKIAFTSWRNSETEVFLMDSDGNNQTRIAAGASPTWSPDGTKIAFINWYNGNPKIFVMNADGSNQTLLTDNYGLESNPCWGVLNGTAPSLGDISIANVGVTSVELKGNLTSLGSALDAYVTFQVSKENTTYAHETKPPSYNHLTIQSNKQISAFDLETPPIKKTGPGNFNFLLTGLKQGTNYHFQSKAFRHGTSYSPEMSFKTQSAGGGGGVWVSSTLLTSSLNPSSYGQLITFTATVSAISQATGIPTGTVTFKDEQTTLGTVNMDSSGQAIFITGDLSTGHHYISAEYNGDTYFSSSASDTITQNVNPPTISITNNSLKVGEVKAAYTETLQSADGTTRCIWSIPKPYKLPPGLSLRANKDTSSATLAGKPTRAGIFPFMIRVKDKNNNFCDKEFTITINPELKIGALNCPKGDIGVEYAFTPPVTGGTGPGTFKWSYKQDLPPGLTFDDKTGEISGTPAETNIYRVILRVTDELGGAASKSLTIRINPDLSVSTTSLKEARVGKAYSMSLKAAGGSRQYTWSLADGSDPLPDWVDQVKFATKGVITPLKGLKPDMAGSCDLIFEVKDSIGDRALSQPLVLTVK